MRNHSIDAALVEDGRSLSCADRDGGGEGLAEDGASHEVGVAEAVGMHQIHGSLVPHGLDMTEQQFTATTFRALLCDKIKASRVANGLPEQGSVPRYARASSGSPKFFGVRLAATDAA